MLIVGLASVYGLPCVCVCNCVCVRMCVCASSGVERVDVGVSENTVRGFV